MKLRTSRDLRRVSVLPLMLGIVSLLVLQTQLACVPPDILESLADAQQTAVETVLVGGQTSRVLTPDELQIFLANAGTENINIVFLDPIPGPVGPEGPEGPQGPPGPEGPPGQALVGEVRMWAGDYTQPPLGWLLCDGSEVSRDGYSELFATIGEMYGPGDGSTTFNLPDYRDRSPMGASTEGADRKPLTTVSGSPTPYGGSATHALAIAEIPRHRHAMDHTHSIPNSNSTMGCCELFQSQQDAGGTSSAIDTGPASTLNSGFAGGAAGGGTAPHNNLHPYFSITFIIYAGS